LFLRTNNTINWRTVIILPVFYPSWYIHLLLTTHFHFYYSLTNTMDAIIMDSNLLVFLHGLPDPNQELFVQHTSSFTLFLELPLELRQMIWRKTFPRITHYWSYYHDSHWWSHLTPPIASCINQESRMETLRQYTILEHRMEYNYDTVLHPPKYTFWNPSKDTIKTHMHELLGPGLAHFFTVHFHSTWGAFAPSVQSIVFIDKLWSECFERLLEKRQNEMDSLSGLLELNIIDMNNFTTYSHQGLALRVIGGQRCLLSFKQYFYRGVLRGDRKYTPKVSIVRERGHLDRLIIEESADVLLASV
jgi:hypothetical protein